MAHIGFDLDSVIFPMEKDIDPYFSSRGFAHDGEETRWEIWEHYDMAEDVFWKILGDGIKSGEVFANTEPMEMNIPPLLKFLEDGHHIYMITSRNIPGAELQARKATWKWIGRFLELPWSGIIIHHNKALLPLFSFVDDSIPNLENIQENGIIPVCYTQPWNKDWDGLRCDNLWEYHEIVTELLKDQK